MTKAKSAASGFKLRMQLLRIWFMKNILVWLQCFLIVCILCILTGNITESTPILGNLVYPLFKPLIDEILLIVEDKQIDRSNGFLCNCNFSFNVNWCLYFKTQKYSTKRY